MANYFVTSFKYIVIQVEMSSELYTVLTVGKLDTHENQWDWRRKLQ